MSYALQGIYFCINQSTKTISVFLIMTDEFIRIQQLTNTSYIYSKENSPRLKLKIKTYPSPLARSIFSIYNFRITTFFELTVYI